MDTIMSRLHIALPRLDRLTPREADIVDWLPGGATNREIARALGISERTVHKHLERAYRQLGVTNRTSAIALVTLSASTVDKPAPLAAG